jgi:hypothetical protein
MPTKEKREVAKRSEAARVACAKGAAGMEVAAVEVAQVVGVQTRSQATSAVDAASGGVTRVFLKRRKALAAAGHGTCCPGLWWL